MQNRGLLDAFWYITNLAFGSIPQQSPDCAHRRT